VIEEDQHSISKSRIKDQSTFFSLISLEVHPNYQDYSYANSYQ